jgi:protein-disulfide isomerase
LALKNILAKNEGKVRVVFKNMVVHPQQVAQAHLMACAAAKQGKFAQFYNVWWEKAYGPYFKSQGKEGDGMKPENLPNLAAEAGIDVAKASADQGDCQKAIQDDEAELRKFKVSGTPAFFINGQFIGGGIPEDAFQKIIDEKLKIAQSSGVSGAEYYDKEIFAKGEKEVQRKRPPKRGAH